jgi:hypothetical protein
MTRQELLELIQDLEDGGRQAYLRYDEMLDETCEPWIAPWAGVILPSCILKNCDPIAYRCGFNDWADSEISELREELDRLPDETDGEA